jgi:hypothetical protein
MVQGSPTAYGGYASFERNLMQIDPGIEEPTRDLLKQVIRGEYHEIAKILEVLGEQRFQECLSLCLRVAGYIVIDVCGHMWPTESGLRRIAQLTAQTDLGYELPESDVYDFLARAVLGFEPLAEVFANKERAASAPLLTTASLLVAYRPHGRHWWEYLDVIEGALEEAAPLSRAAFPAALLLSRRARALESRGAAERTAGMQHSSRRSHG